MLKPETDLVRKLLVILFILGLLGACTTLLRPFAMALLWAAMIAIATWPLMVRLQRLLWGKRVLAVATLALALLTLFIAPLFYAVITVIDNKERLLAWGRTALTLAPDWAARIPLVGESLEPLLRNLLGSSPEEMKVRLAPYLDPVMQWLGAQAGSLGMLLVQFLLTLVFVSLLYLRGERAVAIVTGFARRLGGEQGVQIAILAGQTIRAVAMGVVVTAAIQAVLASLGLLVCGVPFVIILTALVFLLCLAQIGPAPVLLSAVVWLYVKEQVGWSIALLAWTLLICSLDNVLRAFLIKAGADLPLLLILIGVIGGLLAFGVIGIFVGPVVLVTAYALFSAWIAETSGE